MAMKYFDAYSEKESGVHLDDDEFWGNNFIKRPIDVDRPVRYILEKKNLTQDFLTIGFTFLVSSRLYEVLSKLTSNHKTYPAVITKKDGTVIEDYRIYYIGDEIACFNWDKSVYKGKDEELNVPKFVRTIVLDKKELSNHHEKNIFRMKEVAPDIIINEYAKNMLKEAKIAGFIYKELSVE